MAKNRLGAVQFILKYIEKIAPNSGNKKIYEEFFARMSDKEFESFMSDIRDGKRILCIIVPNFKQSALSVENNLKIGQELGHDFFQRLWIEGKEDMPTHLTPEKYMVLDMPLRRASQLLIKKISVPSHNKVVDALTGQPTGESKGARISYPELQVSAAMGLEKSMVELMKYRGGDNRGGAAFTGMVSRLGTANLSALNQFSSGVESTHTLKTFLTAAHLKSTL